MYIIILIILITFYKIKLSKTSTIFISSLLIFLLFGLRDDVGIDFEEYKYIYENGYQYGELGYRLITSTTRLITEKFYIVVMTTVVLTLIPYAIYFNSSELTVKQIKLGYILLYISGNFITYSNLIRQGMAASISFLSIFYFEKKQNKKLWICIILSVSFHKSALIFYIIMYLLNKIKINKNLSIIILIITYLLKFVVSYNLLILKLAELLKLIYSHYNPEKLIKYSDSALPNSIAIGIIINIVIYILFVMNKEESKLCLIDKIQFFNIIFQIIATHNFIANRIGMYLTTFSFLFVLIYFIKIKNNLLKAIIFILILGSFLKNCYFSDPNQKILYKAIWMTNKKI